MGVTFANFSFSGKIPSEKDELAMIANGLEIVSRTNFISFEGML